MVCGVGKRFIFEGREVSFFTGCRYDQFKKMKMNIFTIILSIILLSCSSSENSSKGVSYHFFRQNGKIGIVDSKGEITCEPKFDSEKYFPTEFNNIQHSKFTTIYNDEKKINLIIDIYGIEPFPNSSNIRYKNYGNLAMYYDNVSEDKGLHILSLNNKKEIAYFENRVAINFHGNTKYFFSILDNEKWRLFNELGDKIYEKRYRLDVDVLEIDDVFKGLVLSRRGTEVNYINSNGKELIPSNSLENQYLQLLKQKEIDYNKEYPKFTYETILSTEYSESVKTHKVVKTIKYKTGEELYIVTKNSKQGVVNSEGEILLEIKYDKVRSEYKMLFFHIGEKMGMANLNGEIIFQPKFKSIRYEPNNSRYIDLKYKEFWFEADVNGKIYTPKHIQIE